MDTIEKYTRPLQKDILSDYRRLARVCVDEYDKSGLALVKCTFGFLLKHTGESQEYKGIHLVRFSTGLAMMAVKELGLDAIGVSAALLMHCAELNHIAVKEIAIAVGKRTATVIEELLKISNLDTSTNQ